MPSILITGANRGLGLVFAQQYARDGWRVYATCRSPDAAAELDALAGPSFSVHALDVTDQANIDAVRDELNGAALDVLLNNAGYIGHLNLGLNQTDDAEWLQEFRVNTLAPLRMAEAFLDNVVLGERKQILNISSIMASIEMADGGYYPYRATKAGLNAVMKNLATEVADRGVTVALFHPGWARTDMGGPDADVSADESVTALRAIFENLSPADSGKFFNYTGEEFPW